VSVLQWALLLLGVGVVVLLVVSNRRERRLPDPQAGRARAGTDWSEPASSEAAETRKTAGFDEFGVGRPRRRTAPAVSDAERQRSLLDADPAVKKPGPSARSEPRIGSAQDNRAVHLIGLYIAEHEGTDILGPRIHAALREQGLSYGARRIYHRIAGDQALFSVASLVKPGFLDPQEAEAFSTPGLSVFMVLPGPEHPAAAFRDMLSTARQLAKTLNAELFDTESRTPLTAERERELQSQVEEWARRHAGASAPV
jgi:cell division protein ZipA